MTLDTEPRPPRSLPRDESRGIFAALILPAGEAPGPGEAFAEHNLGSPISLAEAERRERVPPVTVDHDDNQVVGVVVAQHFNVETGKWAALKLGRRGRELVAAGHRAVSAEVDPGSGALVGVTLCRHTTPVFASAQVIVDGGIPTLPEPSVPIANEYTSSLPPTTDDVLADPHASGLREVAYEADVHGGRLVWAPPMPPVAAVERALGGPALIVNMTEHRAEMAAVSITAATEAEERDRERYEERQEAIAAAEAEREELLLIASGVPMSRWPKHTAGYARWSAFSDQLEAARREDERVAEAAAVREYIALGRDTPETTVTTTEGRPPWLSRLARRLSFR